MSDRRIEELIRRIGAPAALAWGRAVPGESDLFEVEARAIARAVPDRKAEFAAGRMAARRALAGLGLPPDSIPMGPDRAPVWPRSVVGSISHTKGACLAIAGHMQQIRSVGLDLEGDAPLDPALIPEICLDAELAGVPPEARPVLAKRIFSAKEAAYKAHYPVVRRVFGFHGLQVDLDRGHARFTDHPEVAAIPPESRADLALRQVCCDGLILSLCVVVARD